MTRKIKVNRTVGVYRAGHEYTFEGPIPVVVRMAMRAGYMEAAGGWCAPSETVYSVNEAVDVNRGLLSLPELGVIRGGVRFPQPEQVEAVEQAAPKKARKPRKKATEPLTLESLAEQTSQALDDLRG